MAKRALVCDVQRFSLHDGPGIRTVVFFKGCPLRCIWCQNPEAIGRDNELSFSRADCIDCGDCVDRCPRGALSIGRSGLRVDWPRCDGCFECVDACPSRALSAVARGYSVDELVDELVRDREFFGPEGGVTLSGGEPLLHVELLSELLPRLRREGLRVAVETAGHWRRERVADLLPSFDLIMFDVKAASSATHRTLTGLGNERILDNLRALSQGDVPVRVRMPVVPTLNTAPEMLRELAAQLRGAGCEAIWLLPYHRLWESKLPKLGTSRSPLGIAAPDDTELDRCASVLRASGLRVQVEGAVAG